jgi:hypothetical protein
VPELPEVEQARRLAESVARDRVVADARCADDRIVLEGAVPASFRR